jgi:hypothetical protein
VQDDNVVRAGGLEQSDPFRRGREHGQESFRLEHLLRMRIEGQDHGWAADRLCLPAAFGQQGQVPAMDAIEVADGHGTMAAIFRRRLAPKKRVPTHPMPNLLFQRPRETRRRRWSFLL